MTLGSKLSGGQTVPKSIAVPFSIPAFNASELGCK